jgi:hypothetical protein
VSTAVPALAVALGSLLLALNWPFTQTAVAKALADRFATDVNIRKFRSTYFPPGVWPRVSSSCIANVRICRRSSRFKL